MSEKTRQTVAGAARVAGCACMAWLILAGLSIVFRFHPAQDWQIVTSGTLMMLAFVSCGLLDTEIVDEDESAR